MNWTTKSGVAGAFALLASLLAAALPVKAEIITNATKIEDATLFQQFLRSQTYHRALAGTAVQFDRAYGRECKSDYRIRPTLIRVIVPVVITEEGPAFLQEDRIPQPAAGQWTVRYTAERCGNTVTYTSLNQVNVAGALMVLPYYPGTTNLNPTLVDDMVPHIRRMSQIENCETIQVIDTSNEAPAGYAKENPELVYETWTVRGCDNVVDLVLRYEPGEEGKTQINIEQRIKR